MYQNKRSEIGSLQKEIYKYYPLSKSDFEQLKQYYRILLTYTSNALEGNSLTETETKIVIEDGITVGGKPLRDHFEAVGHSKAYDLLFELSHKKIITEENIKAFHKFFYYHIDPDQAGEYRNVKVFISGAKFVPPGPEKVPELMKDFVAKIPLLEKEKHAVEYAALLHKELVEIHPFIDGNGRTARLLMNLALLQHGYPVTIIPPILRNDYISAIKATQDEPKDNTPFINFISCMVYESQKDYLRLLESSE